MARLQLCSLAAMPWLGLVLAACDPAVPRDPSPAEDAGGDASDLDAGPEVDASAPMMTAGTGGAFAIPPITIPSEGSYCALSVGAQCDGREDCPSDQRCCAQFNPATFSYDDIGCASDCRGTTRFEVCHGDNDDGEPACLEADFVCRPSLIARFDFISVCVPPLARELESKGEGWPGVIDCGGPDHACIVGLEQCCLRAKYDFGRAAISFLEPFCAPLEDGPEACSCDAEPESPDAPSDAGVDASPGDASQPDPGADDDAG